MYIVILFDLFLISVPFSAMLCTITYIIIVVYHTVNMFSSIIIKKYAFYK